MLVKILDELKYDVLYMQTDEFDSRHQETFLWGKQISFPKEHMCYRFKQDIILSSHPFTHGDRTGIHHYHIHSHMKIRKFVTGIFN